MRPGLHLPLETPAKAEGEQITGDEATAPEAAEDHQHHEPLLAHPAQDTWSRRRTASTVRV